MSTPKEPKPAMLFLSVLGSDWTAYSELFTDLEKKFGQVERESELIPFTQTDYYDDELGTPISRCLLTFESFVVQSELAAIKIFTNELERKYSRLQGRIFNLDPGLLTLERLVLATGKEFDHRIYLSHGIWADLTLTFHLGAWRVHPWTFPDYAEPDMMNRLLDLRGLYKTKLSGLQESNNEKKE